MRILDELEREEFYRLKKVQDKKKKIKKEKEEAAVRRIEIFSHLILSSIFLRLPVKLLDCMIPMMKVAIFSLKVMMKICFSNLFQLKRISDD